MHIWLLAGPSATAHAVAEDDTSTFRRTLCGRRFYMSLKATTEQKHCAHCGRIIAKRDLETSN